MRTILRVGAAVLMLGVSVPCRANTITWNYAGTVGSDTVAELPWGTSVAVSWTFDDATPNLCSNGVAGKYAGQSLRVTLGGTAGPLVYTGTGILFAGDTYYNPCTPYAGDMELRVIFQGPDLPDAKMSLWTAPGGLFWFDPHAHGQFPSDEPLGLRLELPFFDCNLGHESALEVEMTHAPEPSSLLLGLTGILILSRVRWGARR